MSAINSHEQTAVARSATPMVAPPECLTFHLGEEEYGIDLMRVMEIRSYEQPTRIVGADACTLGVLNLRGTIVPILDLRHRFGLAARYDDDTVTVVFNLRRRTIGLVVDSVNEVVALASNDVMPAPDLSGEADTRHILGIAAVPQSEGHRLLILLDLEQLLAASDLGGTPA